MNRKIVISKCEGCPFKDHRGGFGNPAYVPYCSKDSSRDLPHTLSGHRNGRVTASLTDGPPPDWCPLLKDEVFASPSPSASVELRQQQHAALMKDGCEKREGRALRQILSIMLNLDQDELVTGGVLDVDDQAGWERFRDGPHRAALSLPDDRITHLALMVGERTAKHRA